MAILSALVWGDKTRINIYVTITAQRRYGKVCTLLETKDRTVTAGKFDSEALVSKTVASSAAMQNACSVSARKLR